MIEIYARLDLTRLNPSEDEMTNRMKRTNRIKQLKRKIHKKELDRFLNAEAQESPLLSERRESAASRWSPLKRRLVSFLKDLDGFIDFGFARYIVRREARRDREGGRRG